MATIVDSYSESNRDNDRGMEASDVKYRGQGFANDVEAILDSCKFFLSKEGSPPDTATAKIYAHTGTYGTNGKPTGVALATSDTLNVTTLTGTPTLRTLTFSGANRITLQANTKYEVVISYGGGDYLNYIKIGVDTSSPSHSGNASYSYNGSTWTSTLSYDLCFYVYGIKHYKLVCSAGNFVLTGIAVGLSVGKRMLCECGSFILDGKNVGLKMTRKLACACGSFTLTGIAVGLKKGYTMICECGKFIFTGIDIILSKGKVTFLKKAVSHIKSNKANTKIKKSTTNTRISKKITNTRI